MININHINKTYYSGIEVQALKEVNLVIEKGEFILIVGKSGSGKSTLLNVIGCMDGYDSGEYLFLNQDVKSLSSRELAQFRNRKIGFVFQSFQLINELTVGENIEMAMGIAGVPRNELLKSLNKKGTTIIMVTHDLTLKQYADRIVEMKDGRIVS